MDESTQAERQAVVDGEQLNLLAVFYYIVGGITMLFSCFAIIYIVMGLLFMFAPEMMSDGPQHRPPPPFLGAIFAGMGSFFLALGWTMGLMTIFAGRSIQQRKRWIFTLIIAGLQCASFPFGTALGVFTFLLLFRESVRRLYQVDTPST